MNFCHVTLSVSDLNSSMHFYQDIIGLSLGRRFPAGEGIEIAFLGSGGTEVELICNQKVKEPLVAQGISLGFEVTSLSDTIEFLRRNDIETGEIIEFGKQARCVFISDPDGVRVQLVEYLR